MKIIVVGCKGQLGRALLDTLEGAVGLDHTEIETTSLTSVREAVREHRPDLILNASAYNAVDRAETEAEAAYRGNALGPQNLAVAAEESQAALLHVSTDYVFDGATTVPYHEFCTTNPLSVYGRSKLAGEDAVRALCPRHYIVRTAWLYSASGKNFPRTILELARKGPLRVVDDQRGSPTYAPHLAAAIARLVRTGAFGTYHLAGRGGASRFELAQALLGQVSSQASLEPTVTTHAPGLARRPAFSELKTLQDPEILLPPWQEGLAAFVSEIS